MKISSNHISLVFTLLVLLTGSWFCYDWYVNEVDLTLCLLNFIPCLVLILVYILIRKRNEKSKIRTVGNIISSFILVAYMLFLYVMAFVVPIHYGIRNVKKYPSVLRNYWSRDLVDHFPKQIPDDAKDVRFIYRMGFLQSGSYIQLYYSAGPAKINELYERFSKMKTKSFQGGGMFDHVNNGDGMPTTNFYTGKTKSLKFPKDYELMIFDWIPSEKEKKLHNFSRSFNHGKSHGVAISKKRNTIVYWAESW